ncbi:MAG TPA: hypothetical protein PKA41_12460 [Verrucomicrobiota bacterium]|nr:hypothetical protein [Verrucomicrobiota bacterium]
MTSPRKFLAIAFLALCLAPCAFAQPAAWVVEALTQHGQLDVDIETGVICGTNGVLVNYSGVVLTADRVCVNRKTGECTAEGRVRIQREDQVWVGEHVTYNFRTRQMEASQFRTGRFPVFAEGRELKGDASNRVYTASHAYVTSDDVSDPGQRIRASKITIVPGEYIKAHNAVVYAGKVPVFYFPYYVRRLDERSNRFTVTPGYRSKYGGFLLGTYSFYANEQLDGALHLDYRTERGFGTGADAALHLGRWGEADFLYYYARDTDPGDDAKNEQLPHDRQRFYFGYSSSPFTNLYVKSRVAYESDEAFLRDFFEGAYSANPQASTYFDVNRLWPNFSLDVYAQPQVNDFQETVERLPEVKLKAFRQQLGPTPLFYESESSAGWYRRQYSDTNLVSIPDYDAYRADTFHQVTMPLNLMGWLNVVPRVGGRFTYYGDSDATNTTSGDICRSVFNTGVEMSFKASRVWPGVNNRLLDVNGVRHIITPSVDYSFVTRSESPEDLPQFDYQQPSIRLLPIDFPDYNSIDSIDRLSAVRLRLQNKLQTKRNGKVETLAGWDVYTDWRVKRYEDQETFSDFYSDLIFNPRSWVTVESLTAWDIEDNGHLDFSLHSLTLRPNNVWSWGIGHWYLRDGFADQEGASAINTTAFWRLNENWGFRAGLYFDANDGVLRQQNYTVYRDFRSWTSAITFRIRDNEDESTEFAVALTFSLKAAPRFSLGADSVRVEPLLGQ